MRCFANCVVCYVCTFPSLALCPCSPLLSSASQSRGLSGGKHCLLSRGGAQGRSFAVWLVAFCWLAFKVSESTSTRVPFERACL